MFILIDEERQKAIKDRVKAYLGKKYGPVQESLRYLTFREVGKLHYLPVGIEEERGFMHKVFDIIEAYRRRNYLTPIVVVKHRKQVVVDGYARAVAAYLLKTTWKAYVLEVRRRPSFMDVAKKDIGSLYRRYINKTFVEIGESLKEAWS